MPSVQAVAASDSGAMPTPVVAGTFRYNVLSASKRFKSSWVELGKLLVQVRDGALFNDWGYPSFEAYCFKELHIRKQTALKLTRSFQFLDKHEPRAMSDQEASSRAPAFEVVEVLAGAEERGQLSADEYQNIRESIWNPEKPPSELRREFAERFPRPEGPPAPDGLQLKRFAHAARKLSLELAGCRRVPSALSERAAALAEDLEELLGQAQDS